MSTVSTSDKTSNRGRHAREPSWTSGTHNSSNAAKTPSPPNCRYDPESPPVLTMSMNLLMGLAATFTAANLYYSQPRYMRPPGYWSNSLQVTGYHSVQCLIMAIHDRYSIFWLMSSTAVLNVPPSSQPNSVTGRLCRRLSVSLSFGRECPVKAPYTVFRVHNVLYTLRIFAPTELSPTLKSHIPDESSAKLARCSLVKSLDPCRFLEALGFTSQTLRVLLIGPGGCGKSRVIKRYHKEKYQDSSTFFDSTTIQIGSRVINVDDTGDWAEYAHLLGDWIASANAIILPYNNTVSFELIKRSNLLDMFEDKPTLLLETIENGPIGAHEEEAVSLSRTRGWTFRRECNGNPFIEAARLARGEAVARVVDGDCQQLWGVQT
ncbi:hypothetical protein SUNI508_00180 [Seiridium unicorne]|uniref:Uncharacterized protein n=1 Tax=Seiridium unicorne TaxID=138068 RepID=A0ABR2VI93_9PEZI